LDFGLMPGVTRTPRQAATLRSSDSILSMIAAFLIETSLRGGNPKSKI
jgi:hypothetical protein